MAGPKGSKWNGFSLKPKRDMPGGLWLRCNRCEHMLYRGSVEKNLHVCTECGNHFRIGALKRIEYLADEGTFYPVMQEMVSTDPLSFEFRGTSYQDRSEKERTKAKQNEAILIGKAFVKGRGVVLAVMESTYLMGSMGAVVGEKLSCAVDMAYDENLPIIVVSASGGARMHEGVVSLGQMAKTSAALARYSEKGGLYISVLTDPTTGGVTASFSMLGDVIIAEPGAMIGFAGRRTIAETIKVELPEGFQTAEFMMEHGFVDMIVQRSDMRSEIARLIDYCQK